MLTTPLTQSTDLKPTLTGLTAVGQQVKFDYSPMQKFYCRQPIDKVWTNYMGKAIAGNAFIFLEVDRLPREMFVLE